MRELIRSERPSNPPLTLAELSAEALQVAEQLRLGHDDLALPRLSALGAQASAAGVAAQRGGRLSRMGEVLALLQEVTLLQQQRDAIGLADVLEHRLVPLLREIDQGGLRV